MPAKSKVNRNDISAEVKEPVAEVAADAKEAAPEAKPAVAKKPRAPRTAKKPAAEPVKEPVSGPAAAEQAAEPLPQSAARVVTVVPKKKILFVASEATPFIATGGLAEVIGSLSKAIAANDEFDVRVVIPLYSDISWDYRSKFKYLGNIFVPLAWRNQYCGIFSYEANNVTFYFIDNEYYFKRPGCYGYYDDGERFAFFCRSVMEIMPFLNFYPEIMHCHDG